MKQQQHLFDTAEHTLEHSTFSFLTASSKAFFSLLFSCIKFLLLLFGALFDLKLVQCLIFSTEESSIKQPLIIHGTRFRICASLLRNRNIPHYITLWNGWLKSKGRVQQIWFFFFFSFFLFFKGPVCCTHLCMHLHLCPVTPLSGGEKKAWNVHAGPGLIFYIPPGFRRLLNKAFGFVMMSWPAVYSQPCRGIDRVKCLYCVAGGAGNRFHKCRNLFFSVILCTAQRERKSLHYLPPQRRQCSVKKERKKDSGIRS